MNDNDINDVAAFINNAFSPDTNARVIAQHAVSVVEAAGQGGGVDEIERLAGDGWPANRSLDLGPVEEQDESILRAAVKRAAKFAFERV